MASCNSFSVKKKKENKHLNTAKRSRQIIVQLNFFVTFFTRLY